MCFWLLIKFAHEFELYQICCHHGIYILALDCKCSANLIFHSLTRNISIYPPPSINTFYQQRRQLEFRAAHNVLNEIYGRERY